MNSSKEQKIDNSTDAMSSLEKRAANSLASIYALRMMGLFMILPVFSLYGEGLAGSSAFLIGLAIGIYGLTQAIFQIPFGMLSDRIGRKPVIAAGLVIFAIGSVVAAMADTMLGVIFGRALQGAGAIAAAIMALTADLTREEQRVKAMAIIGISIGVAFAFSLAAGPVISSFIGVQGIFWLTAVLAIGGIYVLFKVVPTPVNSTFHRDTEPVPAQFKNVLRNPELLRLDAGIFILHMVLTSTFVVLPLALRDNAGLESAEHWWVYLPVLLLALAIMIPFVIVAEKRRRMKQIMFGAVVALAVAEFLLLINHGSVISIMVALLVFFIAFNVLEATLPSMIVKAAQPHIKGTAMGVYSSSQFLGAFIGGVVGGTLYGLIGVGGVFAFCGLALLYWAYIVYTMAEPTYHGSFMVKVGPVDAARAKQLAQEMSVIKGVAEVIVLQEDGIAYLKIDNDVVDKNELLAFRVQDTIDPEIKDNDGNTQQASVADR